MILHRDFDDVMRHAHGLGLATHLVTNGFLLEHELDAVARWVDRVCVSLDHPSTVHDELRGIDGLYARIVSATLALKARAPTKPIVFVCTLQLPIEANGDVVDCMHWGTRPIGNVKDTPFAELLASPRLRALANQAGEACHKCVSIHRVELSEVSDGNLEPIRSWALLRKRPRPAAIARGAGA